jgi:transposase
MKTQIKYSSLDLHAERTVLGVMNEGGKMIGIRRFGTTRKALEEHVGALGFHGVKLTMEMGPMTRWATRICRPLVEELIVCNPRHNKLVSRASNKCDEKDVEALCELFRLKALHPVWVGEDAGRELYRSLVWDLLGWRDQARRLKRLIKSKYRTFGVGECRGQQIYSQRGRMEYLDGLADPMARRMLGRLYDQYDLARENWKTTMKEVKAHSRIYPEVAVFQEIPGIADVGANVFCAIVEDPWRFRSNPKLWKFCRLSITSRSSDGKPLGYERIDKAGHGELKNVSYTAWRTACSANAAENAVKEFYRLSLDRCKGLVRHARLNTQRKILATMLSLWKSGQHFDPDKFFPRHEPGQNKEAVRPGSRR